MFEDGLKVYVLSLEQILAIPGVKYNPEAEEDSPIALELETRKVYVDFEDYPYLGKIQILEKHDFDGYWEIKGAFMEEGLPIIVHERFMTSLNRPMFERRKNV